MQIAVAAVALEEDAPPRVRVRTARHGGDAGEEDAPPRVRVRTARHGGMQGRWRRGLPTARGPPL